jgi:hypothetical protein
MRQHLWNVMHDINPHTVVSRAIFSVWVTIWLLFHWSQSQFSLPPLWSRNRYAHRKQALFLRACITNSRFLLWRINGSAIFFDCASQLGSLKRVWTLVATLLRNSSSKCVSVLNVKNVNSDMARVECNNGSHFTTVAVEYYNQVAGMCVHVHIKVIQAVCRSYYKITSLDCG